MKLNGRLPKGGGPNVKRLIGASIASIGFILSPVSWWNDALVNIPLALGMAKTVSHLTGLDVGLLFAMFYWATNIAGIILMIAGSSYSLGRSSPRRNLIIGVLASIVYTMAVLVILG
ncbi:MAG: hypothetical protein F7C08_01060 [Desulfurococcales archaeon]|nr:hypothetical protein [Desulfurococcales archaeon]MCE4605110.1 hypothetical protein [Desulfurococcales archaeon]